MDVFFQQTKVDRLQFYRSDVVGGITDDKGITHAPTECIIPPYLIIKDCKLFVDVYFGKDLTNAVCETQDKLFWGPVLTKFDLQRQKSRFAHIDGIFEVEISTLWIKGWRDGFPSDNNTLAYIELDSEKNLICRLEDDEYIHNGCVRYDWGTKKVLPFNSILEKGDNNDGDIYISVSDITDFFELFVTI